MSDERYACSCGSGLVTTMQYDARGIPLGRTCRQCHKRRMARFRAEVLFNPNYEAEEPIEPDEC